MANEDLIQQSLGFVYGMYAYMDTNMNTDYVKLLDENTGKILEEKVKFEEETLESALNKVWSVLREEFDDMKKAKVNFVAIIIPFLEDAMGMMDMEDITAMAFTGYGNIEAVKRFIESDEDCDFTREVDKMFIMGIKSLVDYNIRKMNEGGE